MCFVAERLLLLAAVVAVLVNARPVQENLSSDIAKLLRLLDGKKDMMKEPVNRNYMGKCVPSSKHFLCPETNTCIPREFMCDRVDDCKNGEDEQNCPSTTTGRTTSQSSTTTRPTTTGSDSEVVARSAVGIPQGYGERKRDELYSALKGLIAKIEMEKKMEEKTEKKSFVCDDKPCQHGGTCTEYILADGQSAYTCTCSEQHMGDNCELDSGVVASGAAHVGTPQVNDEKKRDELYTALMGHLLKLEMEREMEKKPEKKLFAWMDNDV